VATCLRCHSAASHHAAGVACRTCHKRAIHAARPTVR
jgi:DNA-directed RNA polymerase subunit RPC12/RpoP